MPGEFVRIRKGSYLSAVAATVAVAATAATTIAVERTLWAIFARAGFIHYEIALHEFGFMQVFNRTVGFIVVFEFDKSESFRTAGEFVADYINRRNGSKL